MTASERAELIALARNRVARRKSMQTGLETRLADALEASEAAKAKLIDAVRRIAEQTDYETADFLREACDEAETAS